MPDREEWRRHFGTVFAVPRRPSKANAPCGHDPSGACRDCARVRGRDRIGGISASCADAMLGTLPPRWDDRQMRHGVTHVVGALVVGLITIAVVAPALSAGAQVAPTTPEPIHTCGGPIPVVPPEDVPEVLRGDAKDVGLVGSGTIWTPPRSLFVESYYNIEKRYYRTKLPWLGSKPGRLNLAGERLGGSGGFWADTAKRGEYPPIGFEPSALMFSTDGCWKITAHHRRSTFVFFINVPHPMATLEFTR